MRKLKSRDVFAFARLLDRIGFKEEIKKIAKECSSIDDVYDRGVENIWAVISLASKVNAENEIYSFLASVIECKPEEVEDLDFDKLAEVICEIVKNNDFGSFFKSVQALMKSN